MLLVGSKDEIQQQFKDSGWKSSSSPILYGSEYEQHECPMTHITQLPKEWSKDGCV